MREKQQVAVSNDPFAEQIKELQRARHWMWGSFVPLVTTTGMAIAFEKKLSDMVIPYAGSVAVSFLGVANFLATAWKTAKEEISLMKPTFSKEIEGLREPADDEDTRQGLLRLQEGLEMNLGLLRLQEGLGTPSRLLLPAVESGVSSESPIEPVKPSSRLIGWRAIIKQFVDPEAINQYKSNERRAEGLVAIRNFFLKKPITSEHGLPISPTEKSMISRINLLEFLAEQSPEGECELAGNLAAILLLYGEVNRLNQGVPPSKEILNQGVQNALLFGTLVGVVSTFPSAIYEEAKRRKEKEDDRVLFTTEEAIFTARLLAALSYRVPPEVLDRFEQDVYKIDGIDEKFQKVGSPETERIRRILSLPRRFPRKSFKEEEDAFFRIVGTVPEIKGGVVKITAVDFDHADRKACFMALVYPIAHEIKITITATNETVTVPMEELYQQRLEDDHWWYLKDKFNEKRSSAAEAQLVKV